MAARRTRSVRPSRHLGSAGARRADAACLCRARHLRIHGERSRRRGIQSWRSRATSRLCSSGRCRSRRRDAPPVSRDHRGQTCGQADFLPDWSEMDRNRFASLRRPCAQSGDDERGHQAGRLPDDRATSAPRRRSLDSTARSWSDLRKPRHAARLVEDMHADRHSGQGRSHVRLGSAPISRVGNDDTLVAG